MATQRQHEVFWREIAWPPALFKRKQQKSRIQLNSVYVFTYVDNRERAKALVKKKTNFVGRKTWKVAVRKWEMLAASKVNKSGSDKKSEREHKQ